MKERLLERALHVAAGVVEATSRHVVLLIPRLRLADEQTQQVERDIAAALDELSRGQVAAVGSGPPCTIGSASRHNAILDASDGG